MNNSETKAFDQYLLQFRNGLCHELFSAYLHDHRNQLDQSISMLEYYLRDSNSDINKKEEYIERAIKVLVASQRGLREISELLYFRRGMHRKSLNESIEDSILLVSSLAGRNGVNIVTDIDDAHLAIDREYVSTLLYVVIRNAIESFSDYNGGHDRREIRIIASCSKSECTIKIRDNGTGIDERVIERIFDSGYTTKSHHQGMGLFIAAKLLENNGGSISVTSIANAGAEFIMVLPA